MAFIKFLTFICLIHEIYPFAYDIEFKTFEGMPETDPAYIDFGTLRIVKKSRTEVGFSGNFALFKKLTNVGQATISVFHKTSVAPLQVMYANGGFCDQVAKLTEYYAEMVQHSNMPEEFCPLQPGNYTIKDLYFHLDKYPKTVPLGDYSCTATYSLNGQIKIGYKLLISIVAA